ncbi:MAG: glycosyltransferase family 39 protein [Thermoanaerobaculia bacterium]
MKHGWSVALLCAAILLPAAVRLLCYPAYPGSDDAFIHHAVAARVAAGGGWGIQPGPAVNLSSSPLFTLLAAAITALAPDGWTGVTALTLAAACLGVWCTWWAARRLGLDGLPAALLAATNLHLWRWAGTFLETTLAWAVVPLAVGVEAGLRERGERRAGPWVGLGCLLGAAVLLRYELALVGAALAVPAAIRDRRRWRWTPVAAGAALVLAPWLAFARIAFGTFLPTTLAAKASPAPHAPSLAVLDSSPASPSRRRRPLWS